MTMTIEEIRKNKPIGATAYAQLESSTIYLFKSNHGYRQIKGNLISFYDGGIPLDQIKPL